MLIWPVEVTWSLEDIPVSGSIASTFGDTGDCVSKVSLKVRVSLPFPARSSCDNTRSCSPSAFPERSNANDHTPEVLTTTSPTSLPSRRTFTLAPGSPLPDNTTAFFPASIPSEKSGPVPTIPVKTLSNTTLPGAVRSSVTENSDESSLVFPATSTDFARKTCNPSLKSAWD